MVEPNLSNNTSMVGWENNWWVRLELFSLHKIVNFLLFFMY